MKRLWRSYAVVSLLAILATASLLVWFYRQVAIGGIKALSERSNLALTATALNPIKSSLLEYLQTVEDLQPGNPNHFALPPALAASIESLMSEEHIVRIKIYNRSGVVAFSTKPSQIGRDQRNNQGVISALNGKVAGSLVYRDTFNAFDEVTEEDNLMQTYMPVRAGATEPIRGVFELYSDVNGMVLETERTEFVIMAGALLIMASLYAVLVVFLRHAGKQIELQQRTIQERTEALRLMSVQMLKSEELYKKYVATELQEDLVQSLAAIKLHMENGGHKLAGGGASDMAASLVPYLQEAIHKARAIATGLRPSTLDDFGLLTTLAGLFRELERVHPGVQFKREIKLHEQDIPATLRAILYRIAEPVLEDMAGHAHTGKIRFRLGLKDKTLALDVADTEHEAFDMTAKPLTNSELQSRPGFARMEALTMLSGGDFTATQNAAGETILRASWNI